MQSHHQPYRTVTPRSGFTFLEVVMVLILMASLTLAAFALMKDTGASLREEVDVLKSRIRYAQAKAMGSNTPHGISCTGGTYFLFSGTSTSNRLIFPGENANVVSFPQGVSASSFLVSFNEWGEPFSNAGQSSALSRNLSVTLSLSTDEGTETETLTVTPGTGFVP